MVKQFSKLQNTYIHTICLKQAVNRKKTSCETVAHRADLKLKLQT